MSHPFDRYSDVTDVAALKEFSDMPLRKCIRVNTFKLSVDDFKSYSKEHKWNIEPVLWCKEGFFLDREDRSIPLGKDMLHLLGATYMQEASSMLPVALLDPQPGEIVLDMAAAPGSKSTQIAARMNGQGVLVANDMQEIRIKTLRDALHRLGVINVIITKKMGQWFGKEMVGRFNRVLIDAPCTGQGTARKDADALKYSSEHSVGKNAKLQRELIEAAVHATKIGGRIVYSTCTLTPEENEEVVLSVLKKFEGQVEVVDPREGVGVGGRAWEMDKAIEDSYAVQQSLCPTPNALHPFLRLWPQTYNTEGFFCAVLKKTKPTAEPIRNAAIKQKESIFPESREREVEKYLESQFGMSFINEDEILLQEEERLTIVPKKLLKFPLPTRNVGIGMPFGRIVRSEPVILDHDIATLRGEAATKGVIDLSDEQWSDLMSGKDIDCSKDLLGHVLLRYNGRCVGKGRAREGRCKNHLPRWMVQMSQ